MQALRILSAVLFSWFVTVLVAHADPLATQDKAKQTWQLLDYLAVDYGGAVSDGKVQKASEYEEMKEFAATAAQQLTALPSTPALPDLQRQAKALGDLIDAKADAKAVANSAHALAAALVKAYPFPLSPAKPPDLARAKVLFEANCAACHGAQAQGGTGPRLQGNPIRKVPEAVREIVLKGRGQMPAVALNEAEMQALLQYLGGL